MIVLLPIHIHTRGSYKTTSVFNMLSTSFLRFCSLCVFIKSVQSFQGNNVVIRQHGYVETSSKLHLFQQLLKQETRSTENGLDPDYPWTFSGRVWFRPALVRVPSGPNTPKPPASVTILNLFGWTIGGNVALEYDDSPVGPYREYVTMGATVFKRGSFGQWGSKLYVNTQAAEDVCRKTWNVPAALADIEFSEEAATLKVKSAPDVQATNKQTIQVNGWENSRILKPEDDMTRNPAGGLPLLWTPSIKALWTPFILLPSSKDDDSSLPLNRLRLSASAIRLTLCGQRPSNVLGIPIPIGIVVDNVLIEISRQEDKAL
jgi:hypothetical protein